MFNLFKVKEGSIRTAAECEDHEEMARLLKRIRDISSVREEIQHALVIAAARDDVLTGYELVKFGADVNYGISYDYKYAEQNGYRPPIFNAVECGSVTFLQFLLSRGADVNNFEHRGYTPLLAAYYYCKNDGKTKILTLLLAAGADPLLTAIEGRSFADIYLMRENGVPFYEAKVTMSYNAWTDEWKKALSEDGFELIDKYGRIGVKKGANMIIPPYFTRECMRYMPKATYLFVSNNMDHFLNEVIWLDSPDLSKEELWDIADGYSITAPMWYFDTKNQIVRVLSDASDRIVRIFKNGMYYLYDLTTHKTISLGYSYIDFMQPDNLFSFTLGEIQGKLDLEGRERSFRV